MSAELNFAVNVVDLATFRDSAVASKARCRQCPASRSLRLKRRQPVIVANERNGVQATPHSQNAEVLLIGANSGLGLIVAKELNAARIPFIATRSGQASLDPQLSATQPQSIFSLDARIRSDVVAAVRSAQPKVILSCLGGRVEDADRPDLPGYRNLIEAAEDAEVDRFIMVSALGAGESEESVPFQVMDLMRPLLLDKSLAEQELRSSSVPHVILRPGPLHDGDSTGTGVLTESVAGYGGINRADLALLLCQAVRSETVLNKTFSAIDKQMVLITSPYVRPLEFWEPLPFEEFSL